MVVVAVRVVGVFTRELISKEDSTNAHQAPRRPKPQARRVPSLSTCQIYSGAAVVLLTQSTQVQVTRVDSDCPTLGQLL